MPKFVKNFTKHMLNLSQNRKPNDKSGFMFHIYALFTVAVWGATFVSTKVLLNAGLHAVEIYIYRFILAYILILPFCKRLWANNLRDELLLALGGLTSGSIYFIAENTALKYTVFADKPSKKIGEGCMIRLAK